MIGLGPKPGDTRDTSWSDGGAEDKEGPRGGGQRVLLRQRPVAYFKHSDFEIVQADIPKKPKKGEAIVQNILLSIDPTHRIWASGDPGYMPSVGLGTAMRCATVGKVVATSDAKKLPVGSLVSCLGGAQQYSVMRFEDLKPVIPGYPISYSLSVFSPIIGLTAWVGANILEPKKGDVVVVSAAGGAVGSIVAQLCMYRGAKVIAITGSPQKAAWLRDQCGIDNLINYKTDDVAEKLDEFIPRGCDAYFDAVGGPTLETVLPRMKKLGRIAFCGCISNYNAKDGLNMNVSKYQLILHKRLKVQGYVCYDHLADYPKALACLTQHVKRGTLKFREDIQEVPLSDYPRVVNMLFKGKNEGKLMMKINNE